MSSSECGVVRDREASGSGSSDGREARPTLGAPPISDLALERSRLFGNSTQTRAPMLARRITCGARACDGSPMTYLIDDGRKFEKRFPNPCVSVLADHWRRWCRVRDREALGSNPVPPTFSLVTLLISTIPVVLLSPPLISLTDKTSAETHKPEREAPRRWLDCLVSGPAIWFTTGQERSESFHFALKLDRPVMRWLLLTFGHFAAVACVAGRAWPARCGLQPARSSMARRMASG